MKQEQYKKIRDWVEKSPGRLAWLRAGYRFLPLATAAGYAVCLVCSAIVGKKQFCYNLFVPAGVFLLVTLFRAAVNFPRPYEVWKLPPLIAKDKTGQSFPSRHAASAGVIAMAWWRISIPAGMLFLAAAIAIAASRVLAGVHFIRDVAAGLSFGIGIGVLSLMIF